MADSVSYLRISTFFFFFFFLGDEDVTEQCDINDGDTCMKPDKTCHACVSQPVSARDPVSEPAPSCEGAERDSHNSELSDSTPFAEPGAKKKKKARKNSHAAPLIPPESGAGLMSFITVLNAGPPAPGTCPS